jgi:hypothetical protein
MRAIGQLLFDLFPCRRIERCVKVSTDVRFRFGASKFSGWQQLSNAHGQEKDQAEADSTAGDKAAAATLTQFASKIT